MKTEVCALARFRRAKHTFIYNFFLQTKQAQNVNQSESDTFFLFFFVLGGLSSSSVDSSELKIASFLFKFVLELLFDCPFLPLNTLEGRSTSTKANKSLNLFLNRI